MVLSQPPQGEATLGLIAGSGHFPLLLARSAKAHGVGRVVAIGFKSQTDPALAEHVEDLHYIGVGQLGKLIAIFKKSNVSQAVMAGKLQHRLIFRDLRFDLKMLGLMARLKDRRANSILGGIAQEMEKEGIHLIDSTRYLEKDLAPEGILSRLHPSRSQWQDVEFGRKMAWELARLDIGQTVAVKDKAVVAVEGFEGTDEMIARAGRLAGRGVVVVKVCKPHQDMRFDVPIIGKGTVQAMSLAGASVLAVAAGKTLILDREDFLSEANKLRIGVVAIHPDVTVKEMA